MRTALSFGLVVVLAAVGSCGKSSAPGGDEGISPAARSEAANLFATRCTPCHGQAGRGDGPASASLNPHPRNFTDRAWQQSVNDEHIQKIIQYGGAAVGKSPNMPANPDLQSKPLIVQALAKKIRSFAR